MAATALVTNTTNTFVPAYYFLAVNLPNATTGVITAVTLPTDATTAIPTGMTQAGWISPDGIQPTTSKTLTPFKAGQYGATLANPVTDSSDVFTLTLLEINNVTSFLAFGVPIAATTGGFGVNPGIVSPILQMIIDAVDASGRVSRDVYPAAQGALNGATPITTGAGRAYPLQVTAFPDSSSNTHYHYDSWLKTS